MKIKLIFTLSMMALEDQNELSLLHVEHSNFATNAPINVKPEGWGGVGGIGQPTGISLWRIPPGMDFDQTSCI